MSINFIQSFFDKPIRAKEVIVNIPQKTLDPYEENAVKGTRMPDWSVVDKERDVYGELGWISNFQVSFSKNNPYLHKTYKEYFD